MTTSRFTSHLMRHRDARLIAAKGTSVADVLGEGLADDPLLRSHVLDERGRVRKQAAIYRDGRPIGDRLAMGSTTGGLWVANGGEEWQLLSAHVPPIACLSFAP